MGTERHDPGEALFTKTQRRILGLLFGTPERSFYANEIVRSAGVGIGAALRELDRLAASGLVVSARIGNQKHFQANRNGLVFEELRGIARKILGHVDSPRPRALGHLAVPVAHEHAAAYEVTPNSSVEVPRALLARLCRKYGIRKLSLFGSAARKAMSSTSDVDLLVEFAPDSRASLFDFPAMQREFSQLFGHRRVDLVPPEVLKNPYRRKTILPDLQVLYEAR
jgi:predicted nucleotidyltransferase